MRHEAGAAGAAYASNSSVCAWGLWRSSRACQYGGARAGARGPVQSADKKIADFAIDIWAKETGDV